jgi:hypothetical protein
MVGGFNPFAAGNKQYGLRGAPNIGPVDPLGYRERELTSKARRNAILRKLKAQQKQNFMSSDALRRV